MRWLLELLIRKFKNPEFSFDDAVTTRMLFSLTVLKLMSLIRTFRLGFGCVIKGVTIGRSVGLFNRANIIIGRSVNIGDYVYLSGLGKKPLILGDRVSVGAFSRLIISSSFNNLGENIKICDDVGVGEFSYIGGGGGVIIGKNTIAGQYLSIHPENHFFSESHKLIRHQGVTRQGVVIGENCWIGAKVTVLDGARIGSGCVVAAGSVVKGVFEDDCIIAGIPAKVIRKRIESN